MRESLNQIDPTKTRHCGLLYNHILAVSSPNVIAGQIDHLVHVVSDDNFTW